MPDPRSRITASRMLVLALALAALFLCFTSLSATRLDGSPVNWQTLGLLLSGQIAHGKLTVEWPTFLTYANVIDIGGSCAISLILAVGSTFVIIAAGIDLSVGRLIALTHVMMVVVANRTGSFAMGVVVCLGVGLAAGLFNGGVSVRFRIPSFIVTLGSMMIARGLAMVVAGGKSIGSNFAVPEVLLRLIWGIEGLLLGVVEMLANLVHTGGAPIALERVAPLVLFRQFFPIAAALGVVAVGHVLLVRTVVGRHVFAVGSNAETARLCGVHVGRVQILTFLLSGLCTGLAGLVFWVRQGTGDPLAGDGLELYAIAAVIVGGTSLSGGRGSIIGTLLGGLLMGLLAYGLFFFLVPSQWQWVTIGTVVIVTVLVDRLKRNE